MAKKVKQDWRRPGVRASFYFADRAVLKRLDKNRKRQSRAEYVEGLMPSVQAKTA